MNYQGILEFKGTWRKYQARVLQNAEKYMKDKRVHIVAAPGSGKTTLGIELIKRMSEPALVLAPSITIREQWVARITDAFLCEGADPKEYLSQNLKDPRAITVVTYQALHSALTGYRGMLEEDDEEVKKSTENETENPAVAEEVDFSDFDLFAMIKDNCIGVLCLDECHHLRSEWWKALEQVKKECGNLKVIALTATPPYDSTPAMWNRYMEMCGEIDEEITIPELVKEGSLCPHQDFVYFNYPTEEEKQEVALFEARSKTFYEKIMQDEEFFSAIKTHECLNGTVNADRLLENPSYFSSLLIYLKAKNMTFPGSLQKLLGAKKLPVMNMSWLEMLLQGFLYDDRESYRVPEEYVEKLIADLKTNGLIEKKRVSFLANEKVQKLLTNSKGKANSIRDIVFHEYEASGKELRLLVLTDYIRKEYEKSIGNPQSSLNALGVLPFFEMLRRECVNSGKDLRLGVLCGTIVIIPAEAKEALLQEVEGVGKVTFSAVGNLPETDYLKVNAIGDAHFLTGAVTNIFTKGYMQALVGTKSLLGEGWDSPCINSLILASFVGSFMLSNQMRGRAIRVFKDKPEKASNIWHLVCVNPQNEAVNTENVEEISEDFALLNRRMEHFLGLHYTENYIESGIDRMSVIKPPFDEENIKKINAKMLELSGHRDTLKERWQNALTIMKRMDIVEETEVPQNSVSATVYKDTLRKVILIAIAAVILLAAFIVAKVNGKFTSVLWGIGLVASGIALLSKFPKLSLLGSPLKRLRAYGTAIRKALLREGLLENDQSKVMVEARDVATQSIYLSGGSNRDKEVFTKAVKEFFAVVDNQRYILVKKGNHKGCDGFYCVPECFGKNKESAERFAACMTPYVGEYMLVYTRNEEGRQLLLEGRIKAMANREERCVSRKTVKDALQ